MQYLVREEDFAEAVALLEQMELAKPGRVFRTSRADLLQPIQPCALLRSPQDWGMDSEG